ncbi:MAG TPA: DMT family transporter [Gaiellaceae bacterium]|nr:DMT family transporter [Gaiellaceae bacterium]
MSAVLFALCSAALFGSLSVTLRSALRRQPDPEAGALATALVALVPCGSVALASWDWGGRVWPFLLAGLLAPGGSQILYVLAIRDAGPSRTAVLVGTAPLVSVTIALAALGEPVSAALVLGAVLIVLGGAVLAGEQVRPDTFRGVGVLFALASAAFFATRDNLVRHLATGSSVQPQLAASATIVAGLAVMAGYLLVRRSPGRTIRDVRAALRPFAPSGLVWGLSYVFLFEAFYRGRVSVVSPLVATESLVGVLLAAFLLRRSELVGRHLWIGACLVVAGGALIGALR